MLVVEHDREAILAADHVVDMGPGAGAHGGQHRRRGHARGNHGDSHVDHRPVAVGRRSAFPSPRTRKQRDERSDPLSGARAHNLKNVTVEIPIGLMTCVTGVSGSGKSSLIVDTLAPRGARQALRAAGAVGACDGIEGLEHIDKVISIDQAPIGRTPRSNPATYTGVFSLLRELYAGLPESRARGYKAGRFSFNVKGGRCEACQGDGVLRVEMHFLPDMFVTCETCQGRRYNRETLEVLYRGHVDRRRARSHGEQALELFETIPRVRDRLAALCRVGLGYITLGQPATTLSGGEAQRVKLARELARKATGRTLYVLDEPTTGLHFSDIEVLDGRARGSARRGQHGRRHRAQPRRRRLRRLGHRPRPRRRRARRRPRRRRGPPKQVCEVDRFTHRSLPAPGAAICHRGGDDRHREGAPRCARQR